MRIEIGDKAYELEYTVNAVCDLEELTGKDLGQVAGTRGLTGLRALLWCGLTEHTPGLTIKAAGQLLQTAMKEKGRAELLRVIGEAIEQAGFLGAQGVKKP